ncbi:hypothetical protein [Legionella shakespearei]|nr:hypothetical protein [Legionella shakespearei]
MFHKIVALFMTAILHAGCLQANTNNHAHHEAQTAPNSLSLEISLKEPLAKGKMTSIQLELIDSKSHKQLTLADLKTVHTEKLHLLIIDPTLSDYHHIHPVMDKKTGMFVFDFTPQTNGAYRLWADVTPLATNQQTYVMADMGVPSKQIPIINKTVNTVVHLNEYTFALKFDGEVKAGKPAMGTITVTKDNKSFTSLEPVMGAFAHIVGFGEEYHSVLHIHPMGKEPTKSSDRGGPTLEFHIEPEKTGFVKLFAQMRIGGQEIFVPFGIEVKQ